MAVTAGVDNFTTKIYNAQELTERPVLLNSLVDMINDAFKDNSALLQTEQLRFPTPERFTTELGPDGLCTIMQQTAEAAGDASLIVATVSARPDDRVDAHDPGRDASDATPWYLFGAASSRLTGHRKRGFVEICTKQIEEAMWRTVPLEVRTKPIRTKMYVVEDLYGHYWNKRGYTDTFSTIIPAGQWGCANSFKLNTKIKFMEYEQPLHLEEKISAAIQMPSPILLVHATETK